MARIMVCEPVEETRVLIERLVQRLGHEIVSGGSADGVNVVFYEPGSGAALKSARMVHRASPNAHMVALSAAPPVQPLTAPRPFATLLQPVSPTDIARVLDAALTGSVLASSTS